jgi:aryl-alcohol dehydrogenase
MAGSSGDEDRRAAQRFGASRRQHDRTRRHGNTPMKFTAALLQDGQNAFNLGQVSLGDLRPDEVLVRMVAAGICHTDLSVRDGHVPVPRPVVLGHEGSGVVERIGSAVSKVAVGDPVALTFMSCGTCPACASALPPYCSQFTPLNFSGLRADGSSALSREGGRVGGHFFGQSSFAEYSVANQRNVVAVRPDVELDKIGPFGCAIQTGAGAILNVLKPKAGDSVVVLGGGGVGLSAVMAAAVMECAPIIVVEPRAERRGLALSVGATAAIDPTGVDLTEAILAATGAGAHTVFDTTGVVAVIDAAIESLGRRGTLGLVGMHGMAARSTFSVVNLMRKGAAIRGIIEGDSNPDVFLPHLVDLFVQGRFPVDRMMKLYDFESIDAAVADQISGAVIKPVLKFR